MQVTQLTDHAPTERALLAMNAGCRVVWHYRPRGGYGYVVPVAGIVRTVRGAMATIDVARKVAGQWRVEQRRVKLASLTGRTVFVAELDAADLQPAVTQGVLEFPSGGGA